MKDWAIEYIKLKTEVYELKVKLDQKEFTLQNTFNHWQGAMEQLTREREITAMLREALEHYESAHYCNEGYPCSHDQTAREALAREKEMRK